MSTEVKFNYRVLAVHTLRVNIKSLANESRLIRHETKRCGKEYKTILSDHRRNYVREEARLAHLAQGYLRGRPYKCIENKAIQPFSYAKLIAKINKHCGRTEVDMIRIGNWMHPTN